jgi:hypothetical protein
MIRDKISIRSTLFITALLVFCPLVLSQKDLSVSLIQLIANPEKYDGEQVEVIGFLRLEFEGNRIYLHEVDYTHNIGENAVRIGITKKQMKDLEDKNMHYVFVVGRFKAGQRGTSNANGTIVDITKVEVWPPAKPISGPK